MSLVGPEKVSIVACHAPVEWLTSRTLSTGESLDPLPMSLGAPLLIRDVREHPSAAEVDFVRSHGVAGYAGAPILSDSGEALGTLAVMTFEPRDWHETDAETLALLAEAVGARFEWNRVTGHLGRMQGELDKSRERAREMIRGKAGFLTSMSHELRTPLNSVIGFCELMLRNRERNLNERQLDQLERIRSESAYLLLVVNDIADLARVESGQLTLDFAEVDPVDLIAGVVRKAGGVTPKKGLQLRTEVPDQVGSLRTDPARFRQLLQNLVGNAVKFTRAGLVRVRLEADPATGHPLRIVVADTGPGIAADRIESIFQAFEHDESEVDGSYRGTGLGLSICRSLAPRLGCRIRVESRVGEGSTFTVELPPS